jgi:hypothetical protein
MRERGVVGHTLVFSLGLLAEIKFQQVYNPSQNHCVHVVHFLHRANTMTVSFISTGISQPRTGTSATTGISPAPHGPRGTAGKCGEAAAREDSRWIASPRRQLAAVVAIGSCVDAQVT